MIGNRIKQIRVALGLTQDDIAQRIGVSRYNVSNIENERINATQRVIDDIVMAYNVNPEWLETGQGEMFRDLSREEKIAAFVGEALADETDSFKRDLISLLASLDETGWQKLRDAAQVVVDAIERQKKEGD